MNRVGEVREMRNAETELIIIQACLEVVTGERFKIERLTSRSEGGGWKVPIRQLAGRLPYLPHRSARGWGCDSLGLLTTGCIGHWM